MTFFKTVSYAKMGNPQQQNNRRPFNSLAWVVLNFRFLH